MNIEEVRDFGLSLPFVTERMPFGPDTYSLEIGGRIFCLMDLKGEADYYNLKVDPDWSEELRATYRGITPGFHMNKRHWVSVKFNSDVPDALQLRLIEHSYRQAGKNLPKKIRKELGLE